MGSGATASVTAVIAAAGSGERLGAGGPKAFVPLAGPADGRVVDRRLPQGRRRGDRRRRPARPRLRAGRRRAPRLRRAAGSAEHPGPGRRRDPLGIGIQRAGRGRDRAGRDPRRGAAAAGRRADRGRARDAEADPEAAGAIAAAPVTDTIKRAASRRVGERLHDAMAKRRLVVGETLDRGELWAAQTPQVFRVAALRAALEGDSGEVAAATDEAMLVEAAGGRVLIHPAPRPRTSR